MNNYSLKTIKDISAIFFIGFLLIITLQSLTLKISKLLPDTSIFQQAIAQHLSNNLLINKNIEHQNNSGNIISASGHFANNQIKDGIVTWIQGGYWNLKIHNITNSNNNNYTGNNDYKANFMANFTMIKPDGSLSHNHIIKNFSSNQVIFNDRDIVVTGIADILSDNNNNNNNNNNSSSSDSNYSKGEYKQVPLLIHLMGKKVLGLTIDAGKTEGHFSSSNEMFGTLISGVGLNNLNTAKTMTNKNNSMIMMMPH